jgi:hypothetical protein
MLIYHFCPVQEACHWMYALHQKKVLASEAGLVVAAKMVLVVTMASFDGAQGHAPNQRTP